MRIDIMPEHGGHITVVWSTDQKRIIVDITQDTGTNLEFNVIVALLPQELTALIRGLTCFEADVPPSKQIWLDDEPGSN